MLFDLSILPQSLPKRNTNGYLCAPRLGCFCFIESIISCTPLLIGSGILCFSIKSDTLLITTLSKFVFIFKYLSKYSFVITMLAELCYNENLLEFLIKPNGCLQIFLLSCMIHLTNENRVETVCLLTLGGKENK